MGGLSQGGDDGERRWWIKQDFSSERKYLYLKLYITHYFLCVILKYISMENQQLGMYKILF